MNNKQLGQVSAHRSRAFVFCVIIIHVLSNKGGRMTKYGKTMGKVADYRIEMIIFARTILLNHERKVIKLAIIAFSDYRYDSAKTSKTDGSRCSANAGMYCFLCDECLRSNSHRHYSRRRGKPCKTLGHVRLCGRASCRRKGGCLLY